MAGMQDYWEFCDDFIGAGTFVASAGLDPWVIADTSSAGTPTYARLDHGETAGAFAPGVAQLAFDSQAEVQNVCLSFGNKLAFDIDGLLGFECRVRLAAATGGLKDSATTIAWGLTGDRDDAIDTIAVAALFRLAAGTGVNTVVVESDDTVTNNDDVATGVTLTDLTWYRCKIDFSQGKSDVRFFITDSNNNLSRVAKSTTFDMSGYSAGLQPFFQLQKSADANTDAFQIDYVKVWGRR